jgi:excisionase family DNA binding protein
MPESVPSTRSSAAVKERNRAVYRRYLTLDETAEYLGVKKRTVRDMVATGRLTAYRSGRKIVRLRIDEIDAAMQPFGGDPK